MNSTEDKLHTQDQVHVLSFGVMNFNLFLCLLEEIHGNLEK